MATSERTDSPFEGDLPANGGERSERATAAESLLGTVISGRYRIEKLLGEGGMGAVYQAEHTHMRKRLAVKVLHAEMSRLPEVVARFEREAMAAAHIDHPNVATATDFGKLEDGSFFLVLEYVEGKSLRESIAKGPLEVGRAMRILRQIAAALQRAHILGIVHRDLKPENVMLIDRDGEPDFVKVLDFGIAKVPVAELSRHEENRPGPAGQALTQLGMVYGTPEYMAPEQALGQNVAPSADIYALGIMTYEMLAGDRPFDHESKVTLLGMHVTAPVPPFSQKAPGIVIPHDVETIVFNMLEKEASQRYKDAKELIDAVDAIWVSSFGVVPSANPGSTANPRASREAREGMASQPDVQSLSGAMRNPLATPPIPRPAAASTGDRIFAFLRENPKILLFSGLGVLGLVALVAVVAMLVGHAERKAANAGVDAGVVEVDTAEPAPGKSEGDAHVAAAIALIEKGDTAAGIERLTALGKEYPERADIHRALQKAYMVERNAEESMREGALWLAADPAAIDDLKFDEDVRNVAIGRDREAAELAFSLLETKMGSAGPDILYDMGYGTSSVQKSAAERARDVLGETSVRNLASPALRITLDLRVAKTCENKKAILPRARAVGDMRTAAVLRGFASAKYGCGFAKMRDCVRWPCLFREGALDKTIAAIEARSP